MDHMSLSDELRKQLIESAAWGKAGITPRIDEEVETEETEEVEQIDERKKDWGMGKDERSRTDPGEEDYTTKKGKKKKSGKGRAFLKADTEHEDAEGAEELEEAVHVCPLCTSILDESIDEERILEHLDVVLGLVDRLSQMNEGDEDIDQVIDQTLEELLLGSDEEE